MTMTYGFIKGKVASAPRLTAKRMRRETQYHLHTAITVAGQEWDTAVNVGTNDADDLLNYRLVFDFHHAVTQTLREARSDFSDLTGTRALPALDFFRSDILAETGPWRASGPMDGSDQPEPVASLRRMLEKAMSAGADVYIFGRKYSDGLGVHDVHMNQGSTGSLINNGQDDHNDHNDIWQDGAVLVDLGDAGWAGYFTAFMQQRVPTDDLGNPGPDSKPLLT